MNLGRKLFTFAKSTVRLLAGRGAQGPGRRQGRAEEASKPLSCDLLLHKQNQNAANIRSNPSEDPGARVWRCVVTRDGRREAGMFQGGGKEQDRATLHRQQVSWRTGGEKEIVPWESAKGKARLPKPRVVLFSACLRPASNLLLCRGWGKNLKGWVKPRNIKLRKLALEIFHFVHLLSVRVKSLTSLVAQR